MAEGGGKGWGSWMWGWGGGVFGEKCLGEGRVGVQFVIVIYLTHGDDAGGRRGWEVACSRVGHQWGKIPTCRKGEGQKPRCAVPLTL